MRCQARFYAVQKSARETRQQVINKNSVVTFGSLSPRSFHFKYGLSASVFHLNNLRRSHLLVSAVDNRHHSLCKIEEHLSEY